MCMTGSLSVNESLCKARWQPVVVVEEIFWFAGTFKTKWNDQKDSIDLQREVKNTCAYICCSGSELWERKTQMPKTTPEEVGPLRIYMRNLSLVREAYRMTKFWSLNASVPEVMIRVSKQQFLLKQNYHGNQEKPLILNKNGEWCLKMENACEHSMLMDWWKRND